MSVMGLDAVLLSRRNNMNRPKCFGRDFVRCCRIPVARAAESKELSHPILRPKVSLEKRPLMTAKVEARGGKHDKQIAAPQFAATGMRMLNGSAFSSGRCVFSSREARALVEHNALTSKR